MRISKLNLAVAVTGLVGLAACFLPLYTNDGVAMTFWDLHTLDLGQTVMVMVGYGVGATMGVLARVRPPMARWQTQIAIGAYGFVTIKYARAFWGLIWGLELGGKLMGIAAVAGVVASALSAARANDAARATS